MKWRSPEIWVPQNIGFPMDCISEPIICMICLSGTSIDFLCRTNNWDDGMPEGYINLTGHRSSFVSYQQLLVVLIKTELETSCKQYKE